MYICAYTYKNLNLTLRVQLQKSKPFLEIFLILIAVHHNIKPGGVNGYS